MGFYFYFFCRFQNDIDGRIRAAREKVERKLNMALEKIKELQGVIQRQQSLIGRSNSWIFYYYLYNGFEMKIFISNTS